MFPVTLSVAPRHQHPAAALTLETELVPVLAQGAHLSEAHSLIALGTLGGHGRWCSRWLAPSANTWLGVAALSTHFLNDHWCQHDRKAPKHLGEITTNDNVNSAFHSTPLS